MAAGLQANGPAQPEKEHRPASKSDPHLDNELYRSQGYALASIDYRLTSDATFPAQIHDCEGAIRWLRGNALKYSYDAHRIDVSVKLAQAERMHHAYKKAGLDSTLKIIPGASHGGKPCHTGSYNRLVRDFFTKHLKMKK